MKELCISGGLVFTCPYKCSCVISRDVWITSLFPRSGPALFALLPCLHPSLNAPLTWKSELKVALFAPVLFILCMTVYCLDTPHPFIPQLICAANECHLASVIMDDLVYLQHCFFFLLSACIKMENEQEGFSECGSPFRGAQASSSVNSDICWKYLTVRFRADCGDSCI